MYLYGANRVSRVEVTASVSPDSPVVSTVASGPPSDGSLNGSGSSEGEEILQRETSAVRSVRPQAMVASGDTESS